MNNIGFKEEFMNGKEKLLDDKGNLVGSWKQTKGNLVYLDFGECSCFIAQVKESWLWHKRLCHENFDNLVKIRKHKRVRGIPSLKKLDVGLCKNAKLVKWERLVLRAKTISQKKSWKLYILTYVDLLE